MDVTDYSQSGEQAAILAWAEGQHGSFIDLGAYDGEAYSNTAALADLGWGGICIEAAPDAAGACAQRYARRDDIETVIAAYAPRANGDLPVVFWTPAAMYTSVQPGRRMDTPKVPLRVPPLDLGWLAQRVSNLLPRPLFCSIDIEGDSLDALAQFVERLAPDCVCVEANTTAEQRTVHATLEGWEILAENPHNIVACRP